MPRVVLAQVSRLNKRALVEHDQATHVNQGAAALVRKQKIMLRAFFQPYPLAFLLPWLVLAVLWYRRREKRWVLSFLTIALVTITLMNIPIVSWVAFVYLERPYLEAIPTGVDADAIVLLGGYARHVSRFQYSVMSAETLNRCIHTSKVYQQLGISPIVVTGGDASEGDDPPVSLVMAEYLRHDGVPTDQVLVETNSRNTFENARECQRLLIPLRKRRIILVTSAAHMDRAASTFRKQGFEVIPAPCHFRSRGKISPGEFIPRPGGPRWTTEALHELMGLVWYQLRGYAG